MAKTYYSHSHDPAKFILAREASKDRLVRRMLKSKVVKDKLSSKDVLKYTPVSVALRISEDGKTASYGIALCSACDIFTKEQGSKIALERLEKGFGTFEVPEKIYALKEGESEKDRNQRYIDLLFNLTNGIARNPTKYKAMLEAFNGKAKSNTRREKTIKRLEAQLESLKKPA